MDIDSILTNWPVWAPVVLPALVWAIVRLTPWTWDDVIVKAVLKSLEKTKIIPKQNLDNVDKEGKNEN